MKAAREGETTMNAIKTAYLAALAQFQIITEEYNASDALFDADYEAAGEPEDFKSFYAAWAVANPARAAAAQRLCEEQNAARDVLNTATEALLDWCMGKAMAIATESERESLMLVRNCKRPHIRAKAIDLALRTQD